MTRKSGTVFLPWLFIFLMISSLFWLLNRVNRGVQHTEICRNHLEQIYQALLDYEQEHGRLPALQFFPVESTEGEGSLIDILESQTESDMSWLQCPAAPALLREQGITYLWNTELNQSSLTDRDTITWVLVDMQALDETLPGPHFGKVHILYTDGRVELSDAPPHSLPVRF
jgi:hypothetical protein